MKQIIENIQVDLREVSEKGKEEVKKIFKKNNVKWVVREYKNGSNNKFGYCVIMEVNQILGSRPAISYNDFIKLFGTKKPKKYDLQSDIERLVKKAKKQGIKVVVTFEND